MYNVRYIVHGYENPPTIRVAIRYVCISEIQYTNNGEQNCLCDEIASLIMTL